MIRFTLPLKVWVSADPGWPGGGLRRAQISTAPAEGATRRPTKVRAWSAPGLAGSGFQVTPVRVTEVWLTLTIATSALLSGGRLNASEPLARGRVAKVLNVPPVRVTVGGGATGVAECSLDSGPGPTAFSARTW